MAQLTLIYPVFQREAYLRRLLAYLDGRFADVEILIADDSPAEQMPRRIAIVNEYRDRLRITHHICDRRMTLIEKISHATELVKTPYAAIGADDDYFIPSTVRQAVGYLQEHPDYSVAHGYALTFSVKDGKMDMVVEYPQQQTINCQVPSLRYLKHISDYAPTWYSVHRAENLRDCWAHAAKLNGDLEFGEILPSCLSLIQGKAKRFDELYLIRQGDAPRHYVVDMFDKWFTGEKWAKFYSVYVQSLSDELVRQEAIAQSDAVYAIEKGFWHKYSYRFQDFLVRNEILADALYKGLLFKETSLNISAKNTCRDILCGIPGLGMLFRKLILPQSAPKPVRSSFERNIINEPPAVSPGNNLLAELLLPKSRHHCNFMPIYESVIQWPT